MEASNIIKYVWIGIGLIICISLKLYFGANPIVSVVDKGVEKIVEYEADYDITPIVDAV